MFHSSSHRFTSPEEGRLLTTRELDEDKRNVQTKSFLVTAGSRPASSQPSAQLSSSSSPSSSPSSSLSPSPSRRMRVTSGSLRT